MAINHADGRQLEKSLLEPERDVLDLNPGEPHAAGQR
jgi:hypothetical protein